ncbi:hypothetical protein ACQPZF_17750 [Actinosynnema sp. CS-041913]
MFRGDHPGLDQAIGRAVGLEVRHGDPVKRYRRTTGRAVTSSAAGLITG